MFRPFSWAWVQLLDAVSYLRAEPHRLGVVFGALLAGFAIGAPAGDAAYDYTWRHPDFCGSCHVHEYANENYWASAHAGVTTCHDCHHVPLVHYPNNMWLMIADRPVEPEDFGPAYVPSVLCGACHLEDSTKEITGPMTEAFRKKVVKVDRSHLHRVHMEATSREPGGYRGETPEDARVEPYRGYHADVEGPIGCLDCHGSEGDLETHRFRADSQNCVSCHEKQAPHGRLGELRCQECHLGGFVGESPRREGVP